MQNSASTQIVKQKAKPKNYEEMLALIADSIDKTKQNSYEKFKTMGAKKEEIPILQQKYYQNPSNKNQIKNDEAVITAKSLLSQYEADIMEFCNYYFTNNTEDFNEIIDKLPLMKQLLIQSALKSETKYAELYDIYKKYIDKTLARKANNFFDDNECCKVFQGFFASIIKHAMEHNFVIAEITNFLSQTYNKFSSSPETLKQIAESYLRVIDAYLPTNAACKNKKNVNQDNIIDIITVLYQSELINQTAKTEKPLVESFFESVGDRYDADNFMKIESVANKNDMYELGLFLFRCEDDINLRIKNYVDVIAAKTDWSESDKLEMLEDICNTFDFSFLPAEGDCALTAPSSKILWAKLNFQWFQKELVDCKNIEQVIFSKPNKTEQKILTKCIEDYIEHALQNKLQLKLEFLAKIQTKSMVFNSLKFLVQKYPDESYFNLVLSYLNDTMKKEIKDTLKQDLTFNNFQDFVLKQLEEQSKKIVSIAPKIEEVKDNLKNEQFLLKKNSDDPKLNLLEEAKTSNVTNSYNKKSSKQNTKNNNIKYCDFRFNYDVKVKPYTLNDFKTKIQEDKWHPIFKLKNPHLSGTFVFSEAKKDESSFQKLMKKITEHNLETTYCGKTKNFHVDIHTDYKLYASSIINKQILVFDKLENHNHRHGVTHHIEWSQDDFSALIEMKDLWMDDTI
jgi:hypothetical protein